jgi:hypothetical protein
LGHGDHAPRVLGHLHQPRPRPGGLHWRDWQALANLVTACARCQYQKSNLPLSALGWTIRDSDRTWDGLISSYDALWNLAGHVQRRVAELGLLPFTP